MIQEPTSVNEELKRLHEISEPQPDSYKGDPNFMASLARGLEVLQAFTPLCHTMTIAQISHSTGIPRAAVRRCLYTLNVLGFVHAPDGRHFSLLPRVLTIGFAYLNSSELARAAQNAMDYLSRQLNESCSVAILDGDNILYIARSSIKRIMKVDLGRGSRLPAYATSMGWVLLSDLGETALEAYIARTALVPFTANTVTTGEQLRAQLAKVQAQGYAINDQQLEMGLRSLAVPVHSARTRGVVAAMNIGVNAAQYSTSELRERFLPFLQKAAMDLALLL